MADELNFSKKDGYNTLNNYLKWHGAISIRNRLLQNDPVVSNIFHVNAQNRLEFFLGNVTLIVCEDLQQKQAALQDMFNRPENAGLGQVSFYNKVKREFAGITRAESTAFLKEQPEYQMTFQQKKIRVQNKIIATFPNEKWAIDLLDMSYLNRPGFQNNGRQYLLAGIDLFSRKAFLFALRNKTGQSILNALVNNIIPQQMNGVTPRILISDNGTEFNNQLLNNWCQANNIQRQFTLSHTPQMNSLCESQHGTIRRFFRAMFVKTQHLNWTNHLQDLLDHLNNRVNSYTGYCPNELWLPNNARIVRPAHISNSMTETGDEKRWKVKQKLEIDKIDVVRSMRRNDLQIGDLVKIDISQIDAHTRQMLQNPIDKKKASTVKWTPETYVVHALVDNNHDFLPVRYELSLNGNVLMHNGAPRRFHRYHLQKISGAVPVAAGFTNAVANHLNRA